MTDATKIEELEDERDRLRESLVIAVAIMLRAVDGHPSAQREMEIFCQGRKPAA